MFHVLTSLYRAIIFCVSHIFSHLFQDGSNIVINSAGLVSSKNHSRWLLFNRDIINPDESDVSDATLFCPSAVFLLRFIFCYDFNSIMSPPLG